MKLSRVNQNEQNAEEYIENEEIISMIKLYKGTQITTGHKETEKGKSVSMKKLNEKDPLFLEGWYN